MVDQIGLFVISYLVAGAMLVVGSYLDLKYHKVGNDLWVLGGSIGTITTLVTYKEVPILLLVALLPFFLISIGGFAAWNFGYIGAADIKAFMALSLLIGYFSFLAIFAAVLFGSVFSLAKFAKASFKLDLKKLEAPFIPFLFGGLVLTVLLYLWI